MKNIKYNFCGERFVVTGVSSEIGRRVALDLAETGGLVLAVSPHGQQLQMLKQRHPAHIQTVEADVMDIEAMASAIHGFVEANGKLIGCVHTEGSACVAPVRRHAAASQHVMNAEFWIGMHLLGICIKQQYYAPGASNVLLSCGSADCAGQAPLIYAAAKAAAESAVRTVAKEIGAKGYRVNAIEFGWIQAKRNGAFEGGADAEIWRKRHVLGAGEATDVSNMALFLLSDAARWVTGANMIVDGGFSVS